MEVNENDESGNKVNICQMLTGELFSKLSLQTTVKLLQQLSGANVLPLLAKQGSNIKEIAQVQIGGHTARIYLSSKPRKSHSTLGGSQPSVPFASECELVVMCVRGALRLLNIKFRSLQYWTSQQRE